MTDKAKTIENLLKAANDASGQARNGWIAFLSLLAYLFVTLASVTHKALLLNSAVKLPIIDVQLPLFSFFMFGPFLLVLFHFGLLMQHVSLSRKLAAYNAAIADEVRSPGRSKKKQQELAREHPSRLLLHGYSISQYVAGPETSRVVRGGQWLMGWLTLNILPLIALLYFQFQFLPYHSYPVIWLQRGVLVLDLVILVSIGMFVDRPESRLGESLSYNFFERPLRFALIIAGMGIVAFLSFGVATIPAGRLDIALATLGFCKGPPPEERLMGCPTAWLFEGTPNFATGKPNSLFARNILVPDTDLTGADEEGKGGLKLSFRDRDLRYAVLARSKLQGADFTAADLTGVSLHRADLQHAKFLCARTGKQDDTGQKAEPGDHDRDCAILRRADLSHAQLGEAKLKRAKLEGADLSFAKMQRANLFEAEMQRANLLGANLQEADLSSAKLQGAILEVAEMQGADLTQVNLEEANLGRAELQGAILTGAQMQGTYLGWAKLQGASFFEEGPEGEKAPVSFLQGADFTNAKLQGADLTGAQMQGANLAEAEIWLVEPLNEAQVEDADLRGIALTPSDPDALRETLAGLGDEAVRKRVAKRLAHLLDPHQVAAWAGSPKWQFWTDLQSRSRPAPAARAKRLVDISCKDDTGGYIVKGIARRVSGFAERYEKYAKLTAQALVDKKTCPAAKHLSEETLAELREIAPPDEPEAEAEPKPEK